MSTAVTPPPDSNAYSFLDDRFSPLDLRTRGGLAEELADIANEDDEVEFSPEPASLEVPQTPPVPQTPEPAEVEEPEVKSFKDGATVTIEKTSKGWKATLDTGTGAGTEAFYGRTKDEMWTNLAAGKLEATKKIRQLTKQAKTAAPPKPAAVPTPPPASGQKPSADKLFEIKTQLASDPDAAFEGWFKSKYGLTFADLIEKANKGDRAQQELDIESISRAFLAQCPVYYPTNRNFRELVGYLAKKKLGTDPDVSSDAAVDESVTLLLASNNWSVISLNEAFEACTDAGLLDDMPDEEEQAIPVTPPIAPPAPPKRPAAPPSTDPRIAGIRQTRRTGQVGIRQSQATASAPIAESPSSVEDLNDLTDAQIEDLWKGVRQTRANQSRR